jgi:hypothetical protein
LPESLCFFPNLLREDVSLDIPKEKVMKITSQDKISNLIAVKDNKILGYLLEIDLRTFHYVQQIPTEGKTMEEAEIRRGVADFVLIGDRKKANKFFLKHFKEK